MQTPPITTTQHVIVLHGLGRSHRSLGMMQAVLHQAGYVVHNSSYPSTKEPIKDLVARVGQKVAQCGDGRVNFVTHSLGGILVRAWLAQQTPVNMGRVVMLAPPNAGSEIVDHFGDLGIFRWLMGPVGPELGTKEGALADQLPQPDYEVGVIAGTLSFNPLASAFIKGPNDGKVSVQSTRLVSAAHITLPVSHTFLMNNPLVMAQTLAFLQLGQFCDDMTLTDAWRQMKSLVMSEAKMRS
jgi:pimeloyl-ACP methyl ester carboxylesterase